MKSQLIIHGGDRRYDEISFLKGFSIIVIVIMHLVQSKYFSGLPSVLIKAASLGGTGVHIFFLCSGFGLWISYTRKKESWIGFLRHHFFKIYIPYIIIVLISFFIPNIVPVSGNRVEALLSHIFLYKMFIPQYEESFGFFWFLSTLFQLYFVFIPLCKLKNELKNKWFVIFAVLTSSLWWIISSFTGIAAERIWGSFFVQYLWEFALGMVIADCLLGKEIVQIPNILLIVLSVIGIALEGVMATSDNTLKSFNDVPALIGFGSLALLLFQCKSIKSMGCFVSNFSFEWYLVHALVFSIFYYFIHPQDTPKQLLVGIIVFFTSAFIGFLYHRIIIALRFKRK